MNARAFFDLVSQMRLAQKAYFMSRDKDVLETSKRYEKAVDDEIKRVNQILSNTNNNKI